jgi:hypothetical protein
MLSLAAAALAAACASVPLPEREGVLLYRAKCSGCHRPYAPQEIRVEKWAKTFPKMSLKAKLTPSEIDAIQRYVEPDLGAKYVRAVAAHDAPPR